MNTRVLTRTSGIAILYVALTLIFAPISYGPIQVRISEALTVLPFVFPEAVLGLFIGCLISNIFSFLGILDIFFGSLDTLLAAYLTRKMPHFVLAPLPPVVVNALVVGWILYFTIQVPFLWSMLYVGLGQLLACYGLGLPLLYFLQKRRLRDQIAEIPDSREQD